MIVAGAKGARARAFDPEFEKKSPSGGETRTQPHTHELRVTSTNDLVDAVINGRPLMGGKHTVLARIVDFAEQHKNDEGAVKAFARLELNRMERGIPYLDVIYAAAPLIGLTGTVTGLLQVFSQISPETGLPDPVAFTKGVALAL